MCGKAAPFSSALKRETLGRGLRAGKPAKRVTESEAAAGNGLGDVPRPSRAAPAACSFPGFRDGPASPSLHPGLGAVTPTGAFECPNSGPRAAQKGIEQIS